VAGLSVGGEHLAEVRRLVGFLFQDPDDQLFCPTVREDVAFGPLNLGLSREDVERRITESLAAVHLEGFERRSTLQLSLGERKRVCLAGVLACHPLILALDEPFSNLDPRARRTLIEVLKRFDGSQLIATHDLDVVAELCTRVIVLDEGKIRADGPTEVVLSDRHLMERHGLEVPLRLQQSESERARTEDRSRCSRRLRDDSFPTAVCPIRCRARDRHYRARYPKRTVFARHRSNPACPRE